MLDESQDLSEPMSYILAVGAKWTCLQKVATKKTDKKFRNAAHFSLQ
jgi:hypothetical protein